MDFNTLIFLGFFAGTAVLTYCMPQRVKPYFLLLASYLFYCYQPQNLQLVWVLVCATLITWLGGILLGSSKLNFLWLRRTVLGACLAFSGYCLVRYKYYDFAAQLLRDTLSLQLPKVNLVVPLGLSYFLFQSMGYLFDVYRHKQKPVLNLAHYALFVSFFPCIFTGPIERAGHLIPQLTAPHKFSYQRMSGGAFRMLWGYFKKMVLADSLSVFVSGVYAAPQNAAGPYLLAASLLFSYQLYLDFSGCCDIAIGAGRVLGFDLTENFRRPFSACTYQDLWRRWHISLSSWFRDYVYFSLGGSRCSRWRQILNNLITFLVSGLWHGASWGYVIWGALNGIILSAGRQTQQLRAQLAQKNPLYRIAWLRTAIQRCCVYLLFTACIVFFAADLYGGSAFAVYAGLFEGWNLPFSQLLAGFGDKGLTLPVALVCAAGILLTDFVEAHGPVSSWIRRRCAAVRWPLYYLLALVILFFASFGKSAFIYQNY